MGKRRPERDKTREAYIKSAGKRNVKELAQEFGVSEAMVRKWKSEDKWDQQLKKPRGAPKGNQNAKGHGAPKGNQNSVGHGAPEGNKNAQTHGAYAEPETEKFSEEQKKTVEEAKVLSEQLGKLIEKQLDIENKIAQVEAEEQDEYTTGGIRGKNSMEYWESKFSRLEKLELQYNRITGRILKIMDQMQAKESLKVHREISIRNLKLQREKAMGVFDSDGEEDDGKVNIDFL